MVAWNLDSPLGLGGFFGEGGCGRGLDIFEVK
jgi:hypothetical protein